MRRLRRILTGIRALLQRRRADADLDDELGAFLEAAVDDKTRRGMSHPDAVRAAQLQLGSAAAVKDWVRDAGWESTVETVWQDVKYAARMMRTSKAFTATTVLTLAVGVGANTAIFSVLNAVVLRELPYRDTGRLALLWTVNVRQNLRDGSSYLNFRDWKEQSRTFEGMAVYRRPEFTFGMLTTGSGRERIQLTYVGPDFFAVLGAAPVIGRTLDSADFGSVERPIVISHALWRQRFAGDPAAVGRSIEIDAAAYTVIGVMPADFAFPNANVQAWPPISLLSLWQRKDNPATRSGDQLMIVGRLAANTTRESARAEMAAIAARLRDAHPESNAGHGIQIEPLTDYLLGARTERSLWLLLGAVGFVLLIACANVAGLALARGAARQHEFSLRTALGASRVRLIRQSLIENMVIAATAASLGLFLAWAAGSVIRTWAARALPGLEAVRLDASVILFTLAVSGCGVVAGLLPVLRWFTRGSSTIGGDAGIAPGLAKNTRTIGARGSRRLRRGLVVAEVALAVVLLSGAGLLIRSYVRVLGTDRGFDTHRVLLLQIDLPPKYDGQAAKAEYFRTAFERLRALPGVVAAGAIDDLFITRQPDLRIVVEGQPIAAAGTAAPPLIRDRVAPGYFEAMGISLLGGRLLQDTDLVADIDRETPAAVVVNESMARRFWPGEKAVGKRFKYGLNPPANAPWATVVGVVANTKRQALDDAAVPCIFWPGFGYQMDIVVRTEGDPAIMRDTVRAALRSIDPAIAPYGILSVGQRLDETIALRTLQTLLLGALAAAAFILAVIGVYALIHHTVVEQTQEIGVRMALGATSASVLRMVLSTALGLAAIGLALGLAGSVALARTISSFLYETSPIDTVTFLAVPVLLLAMTTVACLVPARRAARIDPLSALRCE
jgi:predicted permease